MSFFLRGTLTPVVAALLSRLGPPTMEPGANMPKLRRLGPGSWFVPGQNTLHIARCFHGQPYGYGTYLDGRVIR